MPARECFEAAVLRVAPGCRCEAAHFGRGNPALPTDAAAQKAVVFITEAIHARA